MDLLLVRHARAADDAPSDAERPLTKEGCREFRARALPNAARAGFTADRLLHSPWLRAAQTAEMMKDFSRRPPEPLSALAAPPHPGMLRELRGRGVIAVGHQPWLAELALLLCCGADAPAAAALRLPKGGMLWLRGEPSPGGMRLLALWPPEPRR